METNSIEIRSDFAQWEVDRACGLVQQALALDPGLSAQYIRFQEWHENHGIVDELVADAQRAGLPRSPNR